MRSTVHGGQNTITAKLIIRALPQHLTQRVQIAFLDGLLQLISFGILTCIQMVTAKVRIKSRMFILQMAFKLSRKDVEDMNKNEWAQPSGN